MEIKTEDRAKYKAKKDQNSAKSENEILQQAKAILKSRIQQTGANLSSPEDVAEYMALKNHKETQKTEIFTTLYFNSNNEILIESETTGTIDKSPVYTREIARKALENNATAVIIAHNHPSGTTIPSQADITVTKKIKDALRLLDITLTDHVIYSPDGEKYCSFVEKCLM